MAKLLIEQTIPIEGGNVKYNIASWTLYPVCSCIVLQGIREVPVGYTVFSLANEDRHQGSGMSLSEAFAKIMALAHCNYAFGRFEGDMRITVTPLDDVPEEFLHDPAIRARMFPEYRSKFQNDEIARNDLMRRFLKHGLGGYHIVADEEYAREEAKWLAAQRQEMEEDLSFRPFSDGPVHWRS